MTQIQYASARAAIVDALGFLLPPVKETVAEYAEKHRWLRSKESGGSLVRWTHEEALYLVEPMECLTDENFQTVALVGPGQCGKTSIGENWLLQSVGSDQGDMLWYMQTETAVEAYVKSRINDFVDIHDALRHNLGKRSVDDSLSFKKFGPMSVQFLSATENNLVSKTARKIIADEIDAYPETLGDVMALLDVRRQTYGKHSKIFVLSHPDRATGLDPAKDWNKGIMAVYGDSDRRIFYNPCPHCGAWSSVNPTAARVFTLSYPMDATLDEIENEARLICPVNGCVIDEAERKAMTRRGRWIGDGQSIDQNGVIAGLRVRRRTAGFWITGLMSPFMHGGVGGLARAIVKATREQEITGDDMSLRTVMVKQAGVPYAPARSYGSVDADTLAERGETGLLLGEVPDGVRFLVAAVDVQRGFFEYLVRGFGCGGESWVIERGRILADPATNPDDWDKLLGELFLRSWPLADGSGRVMGLRGAGFDSGGEAGVTQQAYAAWTRWRRQRAVKHYGTIAGRAAYSIVPLKGASSANPPMLIVAFPDTGRQANKKSASGNVPVGIFSPNMFKDNLAGQLQRADFGPLYVHFPAALRSRERPHVFFEQLCAEHRQKNGRWEKISPTSRNEALDLMVMAHVVAHLQGLPRINWEKPPTWAELWDKNSMVRIPDRDGNAVAPAIRKSLASRLA